MDKTLLKLYKQVAEEYNLDIDLVIGAETDFWKGAKDLIIKGTGEQIMINGFMNFEVDVPAIKRKLNMLRQVPPGGKMHKMAVQLIDRYEGILNNKNFVENKYHKKPY